MQSCGPELRIPQARRKHRYLMAEGRTTQDDCATPSALSGLRILIFISSWKSLKLNCAVLANVFTSNLGRRLVHTPTREHFDHQSTISVFLFNTVLLSCLVCHARIFFKCSYIYVMRPFHLQLILQEKNRISLKPFTISKIALLLPKDVAHKLRIIDKSR